MNDNIVRLKQLSSQMTLEPDIEHHRQSPIPSGFSHKCDQDELFIHPAVMPNGKQIKLLKTLLTSACERDCFYCPFRAGRDFRRASFSPDEFARLFFSLTQKGIAEGIFLSSGILGGGIRTQDKLLDTADILRHKLNFHGYIHLKIMPGAEFSQVERAMHLANRVSINLEAPNTDRLSRLAPHKQFLDELVRPLKWIEKIRQEQSSHNTWNGRWPSTVTQFVAGGSGESDLELLITTHKLYQSLGLKRAYYSRFKPIPDTPLQNQKEVSPIREHRLYQASFLLRDYGFDLEDIPFDENGLLPTGNDPKQAWALAHLSNSPIEINQADKSALIRVPGIGPKTADVILKNRKISKFTDSAALKKAGANIARATPFLLFDGRKEPFQLNFF